VNGGQLNLFYRGIFVDFVKAPEHF